MVARLLSKLGRPSEGLDFLPKHSETTSRWVSPELALHLPLSDLTASQAWLSPVPCRHRLKSRSKSWEVAQALMDISWMSLREDAGPHTAGATEPLHPLPSVQKKKLWAAEHNRRILNPGHMMQSWEWRSTGNPFGDEEAEACGYWPVVQFGHQPWTHSRHLRSEIFARPNWWEADFKERDCFLTHMHAHCCLP